MFGDRLDSAVLAGSVASLEHDHRTLAALDHRLLEPDQPELERVAAVGLLRHRSSSMPAPQVCPSARWASSGHARPCAG